MNRAESAPPATISRAKLVTIVLLAIVLVVVLVIQFSGGQSAPVSLKRRTSPTTPGSPAESVGPTSPSSPTIRLHWPEIPREEVAAFNPFQIPELLQPKAASSTAPAPSAQPLQVVQSLQSTSTQTTGPGTEDPTAKTNEEQARMRAKERKRRLERIDATASELQKKGVGLVVATANGAVARIGEQELRVGDVINGVLRIVEINPQGIVVEETPADVTEPAIDQQD